MAHERIKLFFDKQKETLDIWQNFNFNAIEKIFKTGLIYACPYRTENGRSLGGILKIASIDSNISHDFPCNKLHITCNILYMPHISCCPKKSSLILRAGHRKILTLRQSQKQYYISSNTCFYSKSSEIVINVIGYVKIQRFNTNRGR